MGIQAHLETLEKKHDHLDELINEANASPSVDDLEIAELKRRKLMLKDEIEQFKTQNNLA